MQVLLAEQQGHAIAFQGQNGVGHALDDDGRQALNGFVQQDQAWVAHQAAPDGEHLLFTPHIRPPGRARMAARLGKRA